MKDKISSRQLGIMAFLSLLSPIVRLLPVTALGYAGSATWLSAIPAMIVSCVFVLIISALYKKAAPTGGVLSLFRLALGRVGGGALAAVFAIWLTAYCGIVLRASAERLVSALYPEAAPWIFIFLTALALFITLLGQKKALFRAGELVLPLIIACLAFVLIFSIKDVQLRFLLPVSAEDVGGIALGALPLAEILSIWAYYLILGAEVEDSEKLEKQSVKWVLMAGFGAFLLNFITIGALSPELCESFLSPALSVVRNIRVFGTDARVDAVIVAIWVITDFALLASLLRIAAEILGELLPKGRQSGVNVWEALGAVLGVFAVGLFLSQTAFGVDIWSEKIAPLVNAVFCAFFLPVTIIIAAIRKNCR